MSANTTYKFEITFYDGTVIQWKGLKKSTVLDMHKATQRRTPDNVRMFGWSLED